MAQEKDHLFNFDERVNTILLIMFVVVVLVLTAKGCSGSFVCKDDQSGISSSVKTQKDSIIIDTVSFIQ